MSSIGSTLVLYLACSLPSAVLIVTTTKRSPLRFLWFPCLIYIAHNFFLASASVTASLSLNGVITGLSLIAILHCISVLVINGLDAEDLLRGAIYPSTASFPMKVLYTFGLLTNCRGINTPWQAKNVPSFPSFFARRGNGLQPSRFWYILRQSLIICWQYLLLDISSSSKASPEEMDQLFGPDSEFMYLNATPEQWIGRVIVGFASWLLVARVLIDIFSRIYSLLLVVSSTASPEQCPPLFGRLRDAYTIRGFWRFWHQILRWPLTSVSNFITRDILHLPRHSILERYTNTFFVFLASGILHFFCDSYMLRPPEKSGAIRFFSSFALAIMTEDGVQYLWRRATNASEGQKTPLWHKVVGYFWVATWLLMTSPWYLYPMNRMPAEVTHLVPASVVQYVGPQIAQGILVVGGLGLMYAVGGEI